MNEKRCLVPARPLDMPHTRPAQASHMLRPTGSLSRPRRPLSRGSSPSGHPAEPLVSYQINRQFSPPQVIRAFGAHCHFRTCKDRSHSNERIFLPVVLHADYRPVLLHCRVVQLWGECANLAIKQTLGRTRRVTHEAALSTTAVRRSKVAVCADAETEASGADETGSAPIAESKARSFVSRGVWFDFIAASFAI